jgi:4-amino-4-deoxy-L-arabinose transferase-like glycosyltransferase
MDSTNVKTKEIDLDIERAVVQAKALFWKSRYFTLAAMAVAFFVHSYNMFGYPLFLGDEGIYVERAWAILREGNLAPYTYWYDHTPVGWLQIAIWNVLLPGQFHAFGMAIQTSRVLMMLLSLFTVALLYQITLSLTRSNLAAMVTTIIFAVSPLALFYDRMVLLDNIMVFWVMLSLYLILWNNARLLTLLFSGLAFGIALLSKETAIIFLPALAYVLFREVRLSPRFTFAMAGWFLTGVAIVSFYPLYALLKSELLPYGTLIVGGPSQHVSLLSAIAWQVSRRGSSILDMSSQFWLFYNSKWAFKDSFILIAGAAAMVLCLIFWATNRKKGMPFMAAFLLTFPFAIYLARGSELLEFYIVPLLPFLALCIGLVTQRFISAVTLKVAVAPVTIAMAVLVVLYIFNGKDTFILNHTQLQASELAFVQQNVPASATIITDDDLWVDLRDPKPGQPTYNNLISHWEVDSDPAIRDTVLHGDWRSIDYLLVSNKMHDTLVANNETIVLAAYDHSTVMQTWAIGDVSVEVRQVNKG